MKDIVMHAKKLIMSYMIFVIALTPFCMQASGRLDWLEWSKKSAEESNVSEESINSDQLFQVAMKNKQFQEQELQNCISHFTACDNEIHRRYNARNNSREYELVGAPTLQPGEREALLIWSMNLRNRCLQQVNQKTEQACKKDIIALHNQSIFPCSRCCYKNRAQVVEREFQDAWSGFTTQLEALKNEVK
jgi:hypothetical protein